MPRQKPSHVFLSCAAGGVPAGVIEGAVLAGIEKELSLPLADIVHGVYASSAGMTISAPIFAKSESDPSKPRYTARQSLDIFKHDAPLWLNRNISALQLLGIKLPFTKNAFHFDEKLIEDLLDGRIGDVTLKDMIVSYFVPVHKTSSERARDQAALYHKLIHADGRAEYNLPENTKIKDLIRATTAVPGFFKTAKIDQDRVCDYGHLDDSGRALARFRKSLPADADVKFIQVGPPRYHGHKTADMLDRLGILRQSFDLARGTGLHSYSSNLGLCQELLGDHNVHDLSPDIDVSKISGAITASKSLLDASPAHIAKLEAIAHDFMLGEDAFKRTCDMLGENHHAWHRSSAGVPATVMREKKQPGFFARLLGARPQMPQVTVGDPSPAAA